MVKRVRYSLCVAVALLLLSGCTDAAGHLPTAPPPATVVGSGLKVAAPVLLTPADFAVIGPSSPLQFRVENRRLAYSSLTPAYEAEIWNPAGAFHQQLMFESASGPSIELRVAPLVQPEVPLLWRVRATLDGHPGPWSGQRTVRVSQTAWITGAGPTIERGEVTQLSVRMRQQATFSDCLGPATWSSDHPEIASVSPGGAVTAHQMGVVAITVQCEAGRDARAFTVVETLEGRIYFKSCSLVVGSGRPCLTSDMAAGMEGTLRVVLRESGSLVAGALSLPNLGGIPFSGTISPAKRLSAHGRKMTCGENGTLSLALEVLDDRLDFRIRQADGPGCVTADGPFDREWQVVADIDRLGR